MNHEFTHGGSSEVTEAGRRFFIALGCADPGPHSKLRRLAGVSADLERLRSLFVRRLGYEDVALQAHPSSLNLDMSAAEIQEALHAWRLRVAPGTQDSIVLYFSGHGHTHGSVHYLCTRTFHADDPSTGLETRRLAQLLPQNVSRLWLVLDICRAGDGAGAFCEAVLRDRALHRGSIWVLAACGQAAAVDQAFSPAFLSAALPFVSAGGCPSQDALARRLQKALGGKRAAQRVEQSSYGPESFNFFGSTGLAADASARRGVSQAVRNYLSMLYRGEQRALPRSQVPKGLGPPPTQPLALGHRLNRRLVALLAALCGLALVLAGLVLARWLPSAVSAANGAANGVVRAPPERVLFKAAPGSPTNQLHEARAAYAQCVARDECPMPFVDSSFAAEVYPGAALPVATFALARREVTQREFASWLNTARSGLLVEPDGDSDVTVFDHSHRVLASVGRTQATEQTGIYFDEHSFRTDSARLEHPVAQVSLHGAEAYCRSLRGRLPSETEWAHAARGVQGRVHPWGDAPLQGCQAAAFGRRPGQECGSLPSQPLPVASAAQDVTPELVHDLGGNLSEWTSSLFAADSAQRSLVGCSLDQVAAQTCHVVRGGSYWDSRLFLRGASRTALDASAYWRAVGFRCAWDAPAM